MTTNTLHAHIASSAADCDGLIHRSYIDTMNDEEQADEFDDLAFRERVLCSHVSVVPGIVVKVEVTLEGFTMDETTDEGYRHVYVRWCEEDCDPETRDYRDVRAEQAGY